MGKMKILWGYTEDRTNMRELIWDIIWDMHRFDQHMENNNDRQNYDVPKVLYF